MEVSKAGSADRARGDLLVDPEVQRILLFLRENRAATVLQTAPATGIEPERTEGILRALQQAELAERTGPALGPFGGVYYLTEAGLRAVREIGSWKRAT